MEIPKITSFDISPDVSKVIFSSTLQGKSDLYILSLEEGTTQKLIEGRQSAFYPKWSPDGKEIAFLMDTDGSERFDICIFQIETGKIYNLTQDSWTNLYPEWSPDGKKIAFVSNKEGAFDIYLLDISTDKIEQLTHEKKGSFSFGPAYAPNGKFLAYSTGVTFIEEKVRIIHLKNGKVRTIAGFNGGENRLYPSRFTWLPDSTGVVFVSNVRDFKEIGVAYWKTGTIKWEVQGIWDKDFPSFSPNGRWLSFLVNIEGNLKLKIKNRESGEIEDLSIEEGVHSQSIWSLQGEKIFTIFSNSVSPPDLFSIKLRNKKKKQLTFSIDEKTKACLVKPEIVRYRSFDGVQIPAFLYKPQGFKRSKCCSLLFPHGGPESQHINQFISLVQLLVSAGYIVLSPNFRGSTGYGQKYQKMSDNDLGGGDLKDIIAGANWLEERHITQKDKIGIIGTSYGGYLTLMALTKFPKRWTAGVDFCGITNLTSFYKNGREITKSYLQQKIGTPTGNANFYYNRSPINFVENIEAPLLILHGKNDSRVPLYETEEIAKRLTAKNKMCELRVYPNEGHGVWKKENQKDAFGKILRFLNKYMNLTSLK